MKTKILIMLVILSTFPVIQAQQKDSSFISFNEKGYTPLRLLFSDLNMNKSADLSSYDSTSTIKVQPPSEKAGFWEDYIYIFGTAAAAAIIYFLWPEDHASAPEKLTFGTPPPPR